MAFENDLYRDEDGEPLMSYDDLNSDPQWPEHNQNHILDDDSYNDGGSSRDTSPPPLPQIDLQDNFQAAKPPKRLIKKSQGTEPASDLGFRDDDVMDFARDEPEDGGLPSSSSSAKRGIKRKNSGKKIREDGRKTDKKKKKKKKAGKVGGEVDDREIQEMWETVAGGAGDSEDDREGLKTVDDGNFIDDSGVEPAGSDREKSPGFAPQAEEEEEDDEIKQIFNNGKKTKKQEKSREEIGLMILEVMAELELAAEDDAKLNRANKPAIHKLIKLPFLRESLSKKQLQQEFLDHGILSLLKTWLEPLPDGSLPNITIRAAILRILSEYPIDLEQFERREQLKRSGIGRVVMFLSKSEEETIDNRKLARSLVNQWSRPLFNKSIRYEHLRNYEEEEAEEMAFRRAASVNKSKNRSVMVSRDDDLEFGVGDSQGSESGKLSSSSSRLRASRPEAMSMDFVVRPPSKINPGEVRAGGRQGRNDRRQSINKKLKKLNLSSKRKPIQAMKLSAEGRSMVKYL